MAIDGVGSGGSVTDGGIAGLLRGKVHLPLAVAPTAAKAFNTLRPTITPQACWRLDDRRFAFDSSFLHPTAATELTALFALRPPGQAGGARLAVFGHADPTGDDAYNKALSGRRALAVYALLTRRADLWDDLYERPFKGDRWSLRSIQTILTSLGHDPGAIDDDLGPRTRRALSAFQETRGIHPTGTLDKLTRLELFLAYMDALCASPSGEAPRYDGVDFVDGGADAERRGAVQGCSDFNPVIVMSSAQLAELSKPARKEERDAFNLSNRRVVVYLFAADALPALSTWPCPPASGPADGCRSAFWSDGEARRSPAGLGREHRRGGRTFACKFYDTFGRLSPCEAARGTLRVWLLDDAHQRMPGAPYRLVLGGDVRKGRSNADGFLLEENVVLLGRAQLSWGNAPWRFQTDFATRNLRPESLTPSQLVAEHRDDDPRFYRFTTTLRLDIDDLSDEALENEYDRRLRNLGYREAGSVVSRVALFRADYDVADGDAFAPPTRQALYEVHRDGVQKKPPPEEEAFSDETPEAGCGCNDSEAGAPATDEEL